MTRPTILDLDLVVVPREADGIMQTGALCFVMRQHQTRDVYRAMLSASPYTTAWDDVRKYVEGLERELKDRNGTIAEYQYHVAPYWIARAEAAEARIAELEKRLADADVVVKPLLHGARVAEQNGYGDDDVLTVTVAECRAARAYMEGK